MKTSLLVIIAAILLAALGTTLDDHSGESAEADAAIAQQKIDDHFANAVQDMGRENGACFKTDEPGEVQCFTHRGYPTITAKVQP